MTTRDKTVTDFRAKAFVSTRQNSRKGLGYCHSTRNDPNYVYEHPRLWNGSREECLRKYTWPSLFEPALLAAITFVISLAAGQTNDVIRLGNLEFAQYGAVGRKYVPLAFNAALHGCCRWRVRSRAGSKANQ